MKARVFVTLKPSVFDPQGSTIAEALHSLGYTGVGDVRQGKYFELEIAAASAGAGADPGRRGRRQAARQPGHRELPDRSRVKFPAASFQLPADRSDQRELARNRLATGNW